MKVEKYKQLMQQQNVSAEATAKFHEALEGTGKKRRSFSWKAALIAACIALMIPLTVFAASSAFRKGDVQIGNVPYFPTLENSYSVRFYDIQSTPLSAFPEKVQSITDFKWDYPASWTKAGQTIGMPLLESTVLEQDGVRRAGLQYAGEPYTHCRVAYNTSDGQLYYIGAEATYFYRSVSFFLRAKITVEHPALTEEEKNTLHGLTVGMNYDVQVSHEEYTTAAGLPVIIMKSVQDNWLFYHAAFAVDNISYEIQVRTGTEEDALAHDALLEVLEGFALN